MVNVGKYRSLFFETDTGEADKHKVMLMTLTHFQFKLLEG